MKCQKCGKLATFHITDLDPKQPGKYHEFHFCDEHARQHLAPAEEAAKEGLAAGELAQILVAKGQAPGGRAEASPTDKRACPLCQISFLEFRNSGRLGCPHDYEIFRDELMPMLENIHDATRHSGKHPRRAPQSSQRQTTLMQLRNDLKRAVAAEDYETAAQVRDQIKTIEQEQGR